MTDETTRRALLDRYGGFYGAERLAVAWTIHNKPDAAIRAEYLAERSVDSEEQLDDEQRAGLSDSLGAAKVVRERGWPTTQPLPSGPFGAGLVGKRGEARNPCIVVRPSGLVALESDSPADLAAVEALGLPPTLTVASSGPGKRHWYYRPAAEIETLPLVAFRFESGAVTGDAERYFLAPPSVHPSGAIYSFLPEHGPGEVPIAELPVDAYRDLCALARENEDSEAERIIVDPDAKIAPGRRRERIFKLACSAWSHGVPAEAIETMALAFNKARCAPPLRAEHVRSQVRGALTRYQPGTAIPADALLVEPLEALADGDLLAAIGAYLRRFLSLPALEAYDLLALWILHAHAIEAAWATPYLRIVSATPGSGKTTLLRLLARLGPRGWHAVMPSTAVLYRKVDRDRPTLCLDELDNLDLAARTETLAVLNDGYVRGAVVDRCTDRGELQSFSAFCAKAYAGLDERALPGALLSRSITLRLEKARPGEQIEPFEAGHPDREGETAALRERCAGWAGLAADDLRDARPDMGGLANRDAELWRPLFAIADHAGGDWPERARTAARRFGTGGDNVDERSGLVALLGDIRAAFRERDRIGTAELLAELNADEEAPWGARRHGDGLDGRGLARMLRPLNIRSKNVRLPDGTTPKGYEREQFGDAFARYLQNPPQAPQAPQAASEASSAVADTDGRGGSKRHSVADTPQANPHEKRDVADVADVALFPTPALDDLDAHTTALLARLADGRVWTRDQLIEAGAVPSQRFHRSIKPLLEDGRIAHADGGYRLTGEREERAA